jgi:hypothetical protein
MKLLLLLPTLTALWITGAAAADQTLTGTFDWSSQPNKKHPITATLTPDGSDQWKVVFNCQWNGKPVTFNGTITGKLHHNGDFKGEASGAGKRTWAFRGQVSQKELSARHIETTGGKEQPTGHLTLTLK